MKQKVLIAIQSSNQELYKANTEALKDMYRRMKETFELDVIDVDVISFTAGEKTELVGDVLYTECLDSDIYLKHRIFMSEYLLKHPEYDVIIKTNATTLINLSYVNEFLRGSLFDTDKFYGSYIFWQWDSGYLYVSGNFIMASGDLFRNTLCDLEKYDKVHDWFLENYPTVFVEPKEGDDMWKGVPDDTIWGGILNQYYKNIKLIALDDCICLNALWRNFVPFHKASSELLFNDILSAYLKVELPQEDRAKIEPFLIKAVGKIMLDNPVKELKYIGFEYQIINKEE